MSGWSYNDGQKGTYLFFRRSSQVVASEEPEQAEAEEVVDTVDGDTETIAIVKPNGDESDSADAVSGSVADVGTVTGLNTGFSVLIGILGAFVGFFIGFIVSNSRKKKRENE